jgi:hypothetical protein
VQSDFCDWVPESLFGGKVQLACKLALPKALIRSVITADCPSWDFAANTLLLKLQPLQNKVLRWQLSRRTLLRDMHVAFQIRYIYDYLLYMHHRTVQNAWNVDAHKHTGTLVMTRTDKRQTQPLIREGPTQRTHSNKLGLDTKTHWPTVSRNVTMTMITGVSGLDCVSSTSSKRKHIGHALYTEPQPASQHRLKERLPWPDYRERRVSEPQPADQSPREPQAKHGGRSGANASTSSSSPLFFVATQPDSLRSSSQPLWDSTTETLQFLTWHVQPFPMLQRKLTFEIWAKVMLIFIQLRFQSLNFCCNLSNLTFQALDGNPIWIKITSMSEGSEVSGWQTAVYTFVSMSTLMLRVPRLISRLQLKPSFTLLYASLLKQAGQGMGYDGMKEKCIQICRLSKRDHLGIFGRTKLKINLYKYGGRMWTGFIWLRTEAKGGV